MTDEQSQASSAKTNAPTQGRIDFARQIADKLGVDLPDAISEDWRACADFINKNKHVLDTPPSDAQLAFAQRIAAHLKLDLAPEVHQSWRACKEFIEANKAKMPAATDRPDKPASEGQIKAVTAIAARKKLKPPTGFEGSSHLCSRFIDEHGEKRPASNAS